MEFLMAVILPSQLSPSSRKSVSVGYMIIKAGVRMLILSPEMKDLKSASMKILSFIEDSCRFSITLSKVSPMIAMSMLRNVIYSTNVPTIKRIHRAPSYSPWKDSVSKSPKLNL